MPKLYNIEAEVHKTPNIKNFYRVKVSLPELGMYINGMMVFPPHEQYSEWSVVPPSRMAGRGKYANIIEFNKKLPLWKEISEACINVGKLEDQYVEDVVLIDIDDKPIDLSEIPF